MESGQVFAGFIYEYFLRCFQFQRYRCGDILPAVNTICKKFNVADQTVKSVLKQLREEGYISMQRGRPARVIFQQTEKQSNSNIRQFFSERWNAFSDLCQTVEVVFQPLMIESFRRLDERDYDILFPFTEQADIENLIHFYCFVLQKMKNPLIMNLFWECFLFLGFPYISDRTLEYYSAEIAQKRLQAIVRTAQARDWQHLHECLSAFWREFVESAKNSIEPYLLPIPADQQISFVWRIYRGRPQICYNLSTRIMYEIYLGRYRGQLFLPSYEKMAKEYNVSVNTVRRTIRLLTQLRVTLPINGKGIRIFSLGDRTEQPDLTVPAIVRNLALFYQSFELLLYSCEDIVLRTLSSLDQEEKNKLINQLKDYVNAGNCELTPWCIFISAAMRAPLQGFREIYANIYGLALWGYPLKTSQGRYPPVDDKAVWLTKSLIQYLTADDLEDCAAAFKDFVSIALPSIEKYLSLFGIEHAKLQMSPSARLYYQTGILADP
ncbi:DNA-binding FadR family transcriptional regulator [Cuneatibacter caecimuris]|uniref:DNA-binding FadR family transcriptional regulator n=2 Tax=Cuneatibacter caecimuris TaxID=1796618 RepID=A0A4Q7PK34_9FIRM|nr:DNA-binding FadR family transcriptional regulator [Cuneatibacter caecimuris]